MEFERERLAGQQVTSDVGDVLADVLPQPLRRASSAIACTQAESESSSVDVAYTAGTSAIVPSSARVVGREGLVSDTGVSG